MKQISVQYRLISCFPLTRMANSEVPEKWGDLSQAQLIAIASLQGEGITDHSFLKEMTGIKVSILKTMTDFERYKLMELLEFLSDRNPHHEFIIRKLSTAQCPLLFAPSPKLKGVTFGQFIFADTYFANYQESGNEDDLNKFIASLYLGMNEKFEEHIIQERFESIGKLDINIRQAIVLNYQLIHEWLALAYPLIFQKQTEMLTSINSVSGEPIPEPPSTRGVEGSSGRRDPNQWIKIFQNFVGDDIIHDEVWAVKPVNTIFAYMTRKYKENARK